MSLPAFLSLTPSCWSTIGAPLVNHLWQSTLFAGAAWWLTLLLRKNHAQARYALWRSASAKFLVPFSLLVAIGSHLGWSKAPVIGQPGLFVVMQGISQPFAPANTSHAVLPAESSAFELAAHLLPVVLGAVWFCGCTVLQVRWWRRLRRMTAAVRGVSPVNFGRELDSLRRVQQSAGVTREIKLVISNTAMEPGILGIFPPVLFLPAGIADRLSDAQLDAILKHELCHVRRRDNLAAALHMLVEAIFWFHPVVWWIGARLVDEPERACDEEVVKLGSDPEIYAEGILRVCEFYLESPLLCAAGVTGSNLKKRIEAIMTNRTPLSLDFARKTLITTAALLTLAVPLVFGVLHAVPNRAKTPAPSSPALPVFTNVSIKSNKSGELGPTILYGHDSFGAENVSLLELIRESYAIQNAQVVGPEWLGSEKYDVQATVDSAVLPEFRKLGADQQRLMLQSVLSERFKLVTHRETRVIPLYALVVSQAGSHLRESSPPDASPNANGAPVSSFGTFTFTGEGQLTAHRVPLSQLVEYLAMRVDRAVLDETGLKGKYDFTLQFTPETTFGPATPSVFKAIEEQLGLKLESRESPVGVLVIDHVEQPTDDAKKSQPHAQGRGSSQSVVAATASAVFETVSVKQNNSGSESSTMNVPTGYGDIFPPAGGAFSGVNVPLVSYIVFAYDLTGNQLQSLLPQLPKWVIKDRFDIQAKANGNPTRDQMRLMMQSLLADRFKLAVHYESQQLPVFALVTQKSSQTGLRIRPHTDNPPCAPPPAASDSDSLSSLQTTIAGGFPSVCRGIIGFSSHPPNRMRVGARDVPIGLFATTLSQIGNIDRPVIDKTGLSGTFDFVFEWTPQANGQPDQHSAPRPAFVQDLREQLGFELESQVGPAQVFAVDHVEKPSEN